MHEEFIDYYELEFALKIKIVEGDGEEWVRREEGEM